MAARHNTCENPSLSVSDAGWGDGGADIPVRTAVSGFPAPVVFAARYSGGGSYRRTPIGAATAGLDYTASLYIRSASLPIGSGVLYFEWLRANMSAISYPSTGFTTSTGVVTRISITGTAPTDTAFVRLILDGWSTAPNETDVSAALYEQTAALDTYFDGDTTPGGSWDGTTGLSPSTLTPGGPVDLDGSLPAAADLTGTLALDRALAATSPAAAGATGTLSTDRALAASSSAAATATADIAVARALAGTTAAAGTATASLTVTTPGDIPDEVFTARRLATKWTPGRLATTWTAGRLGT